MTLKASLATSQLRVDEDGWLPVADLMAGLMMAFVLITVVVLRGKTTEELPLVQVQTPESLPHNSTAEAYFEARKAIAEALESAFGDQLERWDARLDSSTLSIDFGAPEINFAPGAKDLNVRYRDILKDFFPRYLEAIAPHKSLIDEVRIEGHASSDWASDSNETDAWFENMALSQQRTQAVLRFVYSLPLVEPFRDWVRERVVAVGMSSARLVRNDDGSENVERSRRVSFRLITNGDDHLAKIQAGGEL